MITACTNGHGGRRCDVCIAWDAAMAAARLAIAPRPKGKAKPKRHKLAVYQRLLREQRKRHGLCVTCASPTEAAVYCEGCASDSRARAKARYDARVAAGICVWCRLPAAHGIYCTTHYEKRLAQRAGQP